MIDLRRIRWSVVVTAVLLAAALLPAISAEEGDLGWSDTAEFSLVATDGNTESTTLGFKNALAHKWTRALFTLDASGIRVESETGVRFAVQDDAGNIRIVDPGTEVTAESYGVGARYGREITEKFFWFTGASWERNEFAGFDNRWVVEGGVGNIWYDTDKVKFRTGYSLTATKQDNVIGETDDFAGYRFSWGYKNHFNERTTYTNDLKLDGNFDESEAWRGDMDNGLAVSMSERLALKLGLRLLYQNEPPVEALDLFIPDVEEPGVLLDQLDELDTIFTASLVVNFK